MKWWIRDRIWQIKHWWKWRWFRRNQWKFRNIAAWAVHHHASGGSHDEQSILSGQADKRIYKAAFAGEEKQT